MRWFDRLLCRHPDLYPVVPPDWELIVVALREMPLPAPPRNLAPSLAELERLDEGRRGATIWRGRLLYLAPSAALTLLLLFGLVHPSAWDSGTPPWNSGVSTAPATTGDEDGHAKALFPAYIASPAELGNCGSSPSPSPSPSLATALASVEGGTSPPRPEASCPRP